MGNQAGQIKSKGNEQLLYSLRYFLKVEKECANFFHVSISEVTKSVLEVKRKVQKEAFHHGSLLSVQIW